MAAAEQQDVALAALLLALPGESSLLERLAGERDRDLFAGQLVALGAERGLTFDLECVERAWAAMHNTTRVFASPDDWPIAARHGWWPIELIARDDRFVLNFLYCGSHRGFPFYAELLAACSYRPLARFARLQIPVTPEWRADLQANALPVAGVIFHMSRCGSTLAASSLALVAGTRVLSEPAPLDTALTFAQTGIDPQLLLFRAVVHSLSQRDGEDRQVVIKLDAWHALMLPQIVTALPGVPWVFLYRDALDVLVSHSRMPGAHVVPQVLPIGWGELAGVDPAADLGTYAAQLLGGILACVSRHALPQQLIEYTDLIAALRDELPRCFGLDPTQRDESAFAKLLGRDAKRPQQSFHDDRADKQRDATPAMQILAERWMTPHYRALETIRREVAA